jgi:Fic-DOC domain mobile mystery protein B
MNDKPFESDPGQTPIDESERRDLISSIFSRAELNALERENINQASRWAKSAGVLRRWDILSDDFARELHRRMFSKVWRWAGIYRASARNFGWDSFRISEGVRICMEDARYWVTNGTYPVPEAAIRMHHRLVVIHPWVNGNGRHARLLADCLVAWSNLEPLGWGGRPDGLLSVGNFRQSYLEAMRRADESEFGPLIKFCTRRAPGLPSVGKARS